MSRRSSIVEVRARRVLNSTGQFTIEADVRLNSGVVGRGSAPAGTTVGSHEAPRVSLEKAQQEVLILSRALREIDCLDQAAVDDALEETLGATPEHRIRAANLACAVSMAACDAAAKVQSVPVFRHVADISGSNPRMPDLAINVINGGAHNETGASLTESMLIVPARDPYEMLTAASRVFERLTALVSRQFGSSALGSGIEGGLTPNLESVERTCEILIAAIDNETMSIGFDAAANILAVHRDTSNRIVSYSLDGTTLSGPELGKKYLLLKETYPLGYLEDPFAEYDLSSWRTLAAEYTPKEGQMGVVADDLTATDTHRLNELKHLFRSFPAHSVMAKVDQCGTISRLLRFVQQAKSLGLHIVVSQRSQETDQPFLVDLSVGLGAQMMKSGCITRERIVKYNRLLRIGEELD